MGAQEVISDIQERGVAQIHYAVGGSPGTFAAIQVSFSKGWVQLTDEDGRRLERNPRGEWVLIHSPEAVVQTAQKVQVNQI